MYPPSIRLVTSVEPEPSEPNGPVEVSVEIENGGETSSHCVVAVVGLPAAWYALRPHDFSLAPGESAPLRLTIRSPGTAPGRYPFTVSARTDDATVVEALSFTLVMSAGGAMRVYPGLVMRQARAAVTAETTEAVVAARPQIPRLLFLAAPLLLLLLLLGAALSKQSPRATRTAMAPVLSPTATPVYHAAAGRATPTATDAGTGAFGDSSGTPPPTIPGEAQTVTAAEMVIASKPRSSPPVPMATSVARATHATRQSAKVTPAAHPIQADGGRRQSAQAVSASRQVLAASVGVVRPAPASATPPSIPSTATIARQTTAGTPLHSVAGVVHAHAPRQTHTNSTGNGQARRQVATTQVHQGNTPRHMATRASASSRRRRPMRSSYRRSQTGHPQARRIIATRHSSRRSAVAARQGQRRVLQHRSILQRHPQQSAARRHPQQSAARRRPQQSAVRRAPVTKVAAARTGSALHVTWPAHAILYFDRPDALRLVTAPGASIAVTLQAIIRTRGVGGRDLALPYHTTTYAVADRYGRVSIPLRYAYVPTHPTPATLTVVAHTAYGVSQRSAPITLRR